MYTIDLFSGVGGLSLGFEQAGFQSILAIESCEDIAQGFRKNFPKSKVITEDIDSINLKEVFEPYLKLENLVVIGGPPCQGFSQKGNRQGLEDSRNFLFKKFIEAVEILNPEMLLIENVPGILTSSNSFFIETIKNEFDKLGYVIKYKILDASKYGIPQLRKRAFIIGQKGKNYFKWPQESTSIVSVNEAISDLPPLKSGEGESVIEYKLPPQSKYQQVMRLESRHIYNHIATKHSETVLERLRLIPEGGTRNDLPEHHLTKSIYSGTWSRLVAEMPARTITTRFDTPSSGMFTLPTQDRCLTVREAARIQSFPDNFLFTGNKTTQMKQVGNAVPPLLGKKIALEISSALKKASS